MSADRDFRRLQAAAEVTVTLEWIGPAYEAGLDRLVAGMVEAVEEDGRDNAVALLTATLGDEPPSKTAMLAAFAIVRLAEQLRTGGAR